MQNEPAGAQVPLRHIAYDAETSKAEAATPKTSAMLDPVKTRKILESEAGQCSV